MPSHRAVTPRRPPAVLPRRFPGRTGVLAGRRPALRPGRLSVLRRRSRTCVPWPRPASEAVSRPVRGEAIGGAFLSIWHRIGLLSALSVIFVSALTRPASPADEEPILLGQPRTITTALGDVEIAAVKVYSSGALVEVHARLAAAPGALLARPDQVLGTGSQHGEFALTLRNGSTGIGSAQQLCAGFRPLDPEPGVRPHRWDLAFWVPRAAWPDSAPHLVWPVAQLDTPLQLNRVELSRAAMVVRTRG